MTETAFNPWLPPPAPVPEPALEAVAPAPRWAPGAEVRVDGGLPVAAVPGGGLWVLGAHGGAGASTLAALLGARDALGVWPVSDGGTQVVVVARTHTYGIRRAQEAAMQWASGTLPGVELAGLVWVADAPGRTPRELRRHIDLVSGAFPTAVHVPWVGAWRCEYPASTPPPSSLRAVLTKLSQMKGKAHDAAI